MKTVIQKIRKWVKTPWGTVKKHPYWSVTIVVLVVVIPFITWGLYLHFAKGYIWVDWTGFGDYTSPLTTDQRGKTLWDWLQLLIIPIVLTVGDTSLQQG